MWSRSTLKFIFGVLAVIKVQSASEELCPRQEPLPGVFVLKLGSNVVLGCRGGVSVDGVPLASSSVTNKKYRNKQTEDITVSWTPQRGAANATQLISMNGNAKTETYKKFDSGMYSKAKWDTTVTVKPPVTVRKEHTTSRRVLRAVSQTTGKEEEVFDITMGNDFHHDYYEDYDYEDERSRVTRGIKRRTRWTLNGRQLHSGVERGGILRRPYISGADAGNYSCYRGERLISKFRISVGVPPESPTVYCYKKFHTSKVRCDWTSKTQVTPRPLCYLLLFRESFGSVTRVPCSFSRSRCWCAFHMEEGDRDLYGAKLCVSNTAGSATSPYIRFKLHEIIKPDPPTFVVVRAVEGQKHMLKVSWSYPSSWKHDFYTLNFQLRYRPQLTEQFQSVLIDDRTSWTIYDALPHTQYAVQLRAKDEFEGVWSDWTDTVYAVSWAAPEMTTTSKSITLEPFEMFPEGSGGCGEDHVVVKCEQESMGNMSHCSPSSTGSGAVNGANDTDYATVWLCVVCFWAVFYCSPHHAHSLFTQV